MPRLIITVAERYEQFLAGPPVLTVASERLPDDGDLQKFVARYYSLEGAQDGVPLEETLAWFLFEEIGWPEGRGYFLDSLCESGVSTAHYLGMIRRAGSQIDPRLELRRKHWKAPRKNSFLAAHDMLLTILDKYHPLPTPP